MVENFIITGFGTEHGKYLVTNKGIEKAVKDGWIGDFDPKRIEQLSDYKEFIKFYPDTTPLEYFAEQKMGFKNRYHVTPFPSIKSDSNNADTALTLGVKAVEKAINEAGISPEDIDLWLAGCATPFEQAPGIGSTIKAHFTKWENKKPVATINSACVGFNINIERALDYFKSHPTANHVLVVHTEVMSELLNNETSFVPFVTFADAAAAVVISRTKSSVKEGFTHVLNGEDPHMIDFLGANKQGDLYMGASRVKDSATVNIVETAKLLFSYNKWSIDDVDIFIPHQTGHAIVKGVAKQLNVPEQKLYQDVQLNYGNLSGASVPFSMGILNEQQKLTPGLKIVSGVCGLGGEFGGFSYIVPQNTPKHEQTKPLQNQLAFLTGATGGLGRETALNLAQQGCNLILQYNRNSDLAQKLKSEIDKFGVSCELIKCDFSDKNQVDLLINKLFSNKTRIDYVVYTHAITGSLSRATDIESDELIKGNQINTDSIKDITNSISDKINKTVLFVGSVAEDGQFSGSSTYVSSKRALHKFALGLAKPMYKKGVKTIYYMLGLLNAGMVEKLDEKQKINALMSINQPKLLPAKEVADRIVRSLYRPKVLDVQHQWEGDLIVRRDGYKWNTKTLK